ncbi:hypothetical protein QJ857_gp0892 [Tupanvirus soda lake]|uniref:Glycosyltransferase n=2 Tax=Tupanvirus TaxID=2094720 RepID=A0A6N1NMB0_9VIRU|nr:hypothetical protein QJ857_gp0892 [Tupanvirus soda lake]QKU35160.1 hypothetical protein [Tupanvirus soda lake]
MIFLLYNYIYIMVRYAYVYSQEACDYKLIHILKMQLTIGKYISKYMDVLEISSLTVDIVKKYDVICIDHYAINENWLCESNIYTYLNVISECKNICILTRDLHEWTFYKTPLLRNEFNGKNTYNGPVHVPQNKIDIGYMKLKKIMSLYNIKYIISIYDCEEFVRLTNYIGCKSYVLSLHIDTNIFKKLNINRDIDILIYGADYYKIYPLRNKIKNIVKTMNIKYHIIEPLSGFDKKKCDKGLAMLLNRSWLTLCTGSVFNYLVLKYFEASACGSVVIGNMPKQGEEIWGNNYINISYDWSDEQIKHTILNALSDKAKLQYISTTMSDKIKKYYNYEEYSKKLVKICDSIASSEKM